MAFNPRRLCALLLLVLAWAQAQAAPPDAELLTKENIVDTAHPQSPWGTATVGQTFGEGDRVRTGEYSRATVRLSNSAVMRMRELSTTVILPPEKKSSNLVIDLLRGAIYMFSREKPQEMHLRTPLATAALQGTEFHAEVAANGRTVVTMFEGALELSNAFGRVSIRSGEQATVEPGRAPVKTAVIDAVNIIQWCLYYPGVIDPAELGLTAGEEKAIAGSLQAYRAGDLPRALQLYPAQRRATSEGEAVYYATLLLEVGEVDRARTQLRRLPRGAPQREAIEQLIAAVKFTEYSRSGAPSTASEWLAESYYEQSRGHLERALQAARNAVERAPAFGFARVRVAELEFSFGRTGRAMQALERGLELSPRHAQALALQGFALSAENRIGAARRSFDQAIALDGALGNGWLGRGLTLLRQGRDEEGRRDLQTAAALEPNRSILRSYLGKAFSTVGRKGKANAEFDRARELDPRDPTPYLYSAIEKKQENRYNEAVDDLEKSLALNDNRRVYRSSFLLDEDRAVRGANLASIYQNNGMIDQSVREAVRAVDRDYGSAGAHLFLANSYNALRDPDRIRLRYETVWFNELLLSNLLSPVGGGPLSQFVSEQEYSKLFEHDGLGISSVSEYRGDGELRTTNSQYGTFGNISYALDSEYIYNNGIRPNNRISRWENYGTIKLQITPHDTLFFQAKYQDAENGDRFQRYNPKDAEYFESKVAGLTVRTPNREALTYDFREKQEPGVLLLGGHHEWSPGNHTILLLGRLANSQILTAQDVGIDLASRDVSEFTPVNVQEHADLLLPERNRQGLNFARGYLGQGTLYSYDPANANVDFDSRASFVSYSAELQQILTLGRDTLVLGGRFQRGDFHTRVRLTDYANGLLPGDSLLFEDPPADQDKTVGFERISLYLYNVWRLAPWLSLTGGVTYDHLKYPDNFRSAPINGDEDTLEKVSPKVGLIVQPWRGAALRAAYTEAISGTSFDESVRLEPTQVSGFVQGYRSLASESLIGSVAGSAYKLSGLSFEQKLPSRTYLGIEYNVLEQDLDRTIGDFDLITSGGSPLGILPSSLREKDNYREDILTASLNQLVGRALSFGARYRYTHSRLRQLREGVTRDIALIQDSTQQDALINNGQDLQRAGLHELSLDALFNHESGFFGRFEANWYQQNNDQFAAHLAPTLPDAPVNPHPKVIAVHTGLPGDQFWQFNLIGGYRFYRNRCELSLGVLNLTNQDYRLNPLNPYVELPRERTLFVRCRFSF